MGVGRVDDPAIDLVALLGYYMSQMKLNGDESLLDKKDPIIQNQSYNGMTDAVCFSYVMEDEAIGEAFLANYVLKNKHSAIDTLLEINTKEFLYFRESCKQAKPSVVEKGFSMLVTPSKNKSLDESRRSIDSAPKAAASGKSPAIYDTIKMTVLRFFGEVSYKRIVLKTVEFNEVNLY